MTNETTTSRKPKGAPSSEGGQFAPGALTETGVQLVPEPPQSAVEMARDAAVEQVRAGNKVIATVTTHLVAKAVLEACPTAVYLDVDQFGHECGTTVHSGALLYADRTELTDDLAELPDEEDPDESKDGSVMKDAVDESLGWLEDLEMAELSPAVVVHQVEHSSWGGAYRQHRIDLRAALALYPTEGS